MYFHQTKRGFTLIEIIVSLAVFMIVAMVALSALVRIISANRKAQALQESITDLNFALETMSRELRVGSSFTCYEDDGGPIPNSYDYTYVPRACDYSDGDMNKILAFVSSYPAKNVSSFEPCGHNKEIAYQFTKDGERWIVKKAQAASCDGIDLDNDFKDMLSDNVRIRDFNLAVYTNEGKELAFIKLNGDAGEREKERTFFDIQTAISSRF